MNNEYDQAYEDYGRMIDNLLAASDVKKAFLTKGSRRWTGKVSDEFLREGSSHLTDRQLRIIEMILFEYYLALAKDPTSDREEDQ